MPAAGLWVKVMTTLPRSLKTRRVAEDLGIPIPEVIGRLVMLWIYCVEYTPSGLLSLDDIKASFCLDSDIEPGMAVAALLDCARPLRQGFLELMDDGTIFGGGPCYVVHDWTDYSGTFQPSYKKREDLKEDKKKTGTAAHNAAVENALRAAGKKELDRAKQEEPLLLRGRGHNFKNLSSLFTALASKNDA